MSDISDTVIAVFTAVLALATIALAWNTGRLVKTSGEIAKASERLEVQPSLILDATHFNRNGQEQFVRISVKNVGRGVARSPTLTAQGLHGERLQVRQHTEGSAMQVNSPFYWDVLGVALDEDILITVIFTDQDDYPQRPFVQSFTVKE